MKVWLAAPVGALVVAILSSVALSQVAVAGPSLAEAKKTLESARANLAKAVAKIQVDPPAMDDLEAAQAAVGALKTAIDSGAELEPSDLDYAKAALAARKELRSQREYVEERRSKVQLHESRRQIDAAVAKLNEAAKRLDSPQVSDKDFTAARDAAGVVQMLLEQGKALVAQDAKYASYISEVKATIVKNEKTISERVTALAIEKQKAAVEQSKRAFATALSALDDKAPTDAQFEGFEGAATGLLKTLDGGKALEGKDKPYKSWADGVRDELKKARKKVDELWAATGLARMKAEIEPAYKDLSQAAKALRAKSPTAEQIAEARTAAIVVQKLLEKVQGYATRSPPFAQYLVDVKKTLLEVDVALQKGAVEPARDNMNGALKALSARKVGDEAFAAAEAALKAALDALSAGERLEKLDKSYAAYALELKKKVKEEQSKLAARRTEVAVELQRAALETARNDLNKAMKALERRSPGDELFDEAKSALNVLEKTIETATAKDSTVARLAAEMRGLVKSSKADLDKRRLELDLERQQKKIEDGRNELAKLFAKISGSRVPEESLKAVEDAIERVKKGLEEGAALIAKDKKYEAYDREVKKRLEETAAKLTVRRSELAAEAQRAKAEPKMKELARALGNIDGMGPKGQLIEAAEKAMQEAEGALATGTSLEQRVAAYGAWAREAKKTIDLAGVRIAKKKLELAGSQGKAQLEAQVMAARASLDASLQATSSEPELATAGKRVKEVSDAVEAGATLEKDDKAYAGAANKARNELLRMQKDLELAQQARALRKATGEAASSALVAAEGASKSRDLRAQKEGYEKAVIELKGCQQNGDRLLDENKALANISVLVRGQSLDPKSVLKLCAERQAEIDELLKKVLGLLGFEEGPKRSYEKGKGLANQGSPDALAQYEDCVSSGKILEYKNPELKDRKFEVAGGKMTLSELVVACVAECKRIRGK